MGTYHARSSTALATGIVFGALCFLVDAASAAAPFHATKPLPRITITGRVLLGDAKNFTSLGTVDRKAVFEAIPAIRTLKEEHLTKDCARYHFLVFEANRVFQRALEVAAGQRNVDLVVERGGVSAAGIDVVDLTELTKKAVSSRG